MKSPACTLHIEHKSWPIAGGFTISRGTKHAAEVVVVTLQDDVCVGRGECVPYARYGESIESVIASIEEVREELEAGCTVEALQDLMPAGAARNAVDCAMWDFIAKHGGKPAWQMAGLKGFEPRQTAFTLSLAPPDDMLEAARYASERPLLKVKLGDADKDPARIRAVRKGAPNSRLIVDANEGWNSNNIQQMLDVCAEVGVELIEQPLAANQDQILSEIDHKVLICADESVHDASTLLSLKGRYDAINVKLDKTGGLTEAIKLSTLAKNNNFSVMVGCMLASSLAMAPAMIIAQNADYVDLDGPLLLSEDYEPSLQFEGSMINTPASDLWG